MVVVQRVRVRWCAQSRGARHADVRRALPESYALPVVPDDPVVVHDVLADEANGYRPTSEVATGPDSVRSVGLWIGSGPDGVAVDRLPVWAAYPIRRAPLRLFTLRPGEVGRHRANFRCTGCACAPHWYYEQWTIHVAHAPARPDLFLAPSYARDVDDRVHLYGGPGWRGGKRPLVRPT